MEQKCRPLRAHPAAHSFIRRCLTMSPSDRPSASELLSSSEYLHESDFQEKDTDLSQITSSFCMSRTLKSLKNIIYTHPIR